MDVFVPDRGRHHSITAASLPEYATQRSRGLLCPVLVVWGARGGVGKTSTAMQIAQRAGELSPGLRVTLVDGNRAQGDVRVYLRIKAIISLRSMYDAVTAANPVSAIARPEDLNEHRGKLTPVTFAAALAPLGEQVGAVTATTYNQVIGAAREQSDLVVVDTPPLAEGDNTAGFADLTDRVVAPLLASADGWGLAVTDESTPGSVHTLSALEHFAQRHVTRDRMFLMVNKAVTTDQAGDQAIERTYGRYIGHYLGRVGYDPGIVQSMNAGQMVHAHPELSGPIDEILLMMLGRPEFDPEARDRAKGGGTRSTKAAPAWWKRLLGGR